MLGLRPARGVSPDLVAVALEPEGFALAHVSSVDGRARLERCVFTQAPAGPARAQALRRVVQEQGLGGMRAILLLSPGSYAVHVIDAPPVLDEELSGAARWAIQELIDFEVEQAVVDWFESPAHRRAPDVRRISVVAAPEPAVHEALDLAAAAGLETEAVEIPELALRNLMARHPADGQGLATFQLRGDSALIALGEAGRLGMSRWFPVVPDALTALQAKDDPEGSDDADALDDLLLQLQRSLDYAEHELDVRARTALVIAPGLLDPGALVAYLDGHLDLEVEALDVGRLLDTEPGLDPIAAVRCASAIGGALRETADSVQQVDLAATLRRPEVPLPPRRMLQSAAGVAVLLALASVLLHLAGGGATERMVPLEQALEQRRHEVAGLEQRLTEHLDGSGLELESTRLEKELEAKNELLGWITDPRLSNRAGFSPHLHGLARQDLDGVWLHSFRFDAGGSALSMAGSALQPDLVPRLLQRLAEEPVYQGRQFDSFAIRRDESAPGRIEFEIGNRAHGAAP